MENVKSFKKWRKIRDNDGISLEEKVFFDTGRDSVAAIIAKSTLIYWFYVLSGPIVTGLQS